MYKRILSLLIIISTGIFAQAQTKNFSALIDQKANSVEEKVVQWRRYLHEHPELSNRETNTAAYVAKHLQSLGLEVRTGIAKTGVVGILKGGKPGPVVALRADMDGLPVKERAPLPFASKVTGEYNGQTVPVMHACGHDSHVAMLMGTAEVLASMKNEVPGTVVFLFQPAEEGPPTGEEGGAKLMVKEGVLENPKVEAVFGIHISADTEIGKIEYKSGATMASSDWFTIKVKGRQAHGSQPWQGVDPVIVAAQIMQGFQNIVGRQSNLTIAPVVISVGKIEGGVRSNIIPEEVTMNGTIRTLDYTMQKEVHEKLRTTANNIAAASGATCEIEIITQTLVTYNDPALTEQMVPSLQTAAGKENVVVAPWTTGAEDFSYFQEKVPGFYFFLGGMPVGSDPKKVASHHTPDFYIDDSKLEVGVKAFCNIVFDYARMKKPSTSKK